MKICCYCWNDLLDKDAVTIESPNKHAHKECIARLIQEKIMRLRDEQKREKDEEIKRQYTYCITYLEELIE